MGWDISNRWGNAPSQKDPGQTVGNAFKGMEYLYDAKTGQYGSEARQVKGSLPVTPYDIQGKPVDPTPQEFIPGSGIMTPWFLQGGRKLPTTKSIIDWPTIDEELAHKRLMSNRLSPYSDELIYGF